MSALLAIALVGVLVLIGLAAGIGGLDAASRRAAWRRIAEARRVLAARERELSAWADQQDGSRRFPGGGGR